MFKKILIGVLLISGAMGFLLVASPSLRSQVSQVTGLAVAQTSTRWNNLKDAAAGDGQVSGIGAFGAYVWNGASFDRVRGTIANGLSTDVTRVQGGTVTPIDNFANPTNAITGWSLMGKWDSIGGNWDKWDGTVTLGGGGALAVTLPESALLTELNAVIAPGVGGSNDILNLMSKHSWTIVVTGAPASLNVTLEGSIDNTSWFTLDTSTTTTSEMRHIANKPIRYLRGNLTALVGGVAPTVTVKSRSGGN